MHRSDRRVPQPSARKLAAQSLAALAIAFAWASAAHAVDPQPAVDGRQIGQFSLRDVHGAQHAADEWRRNTAVILFFIGTECPASNGYAPQMQRIATKYAPQGVACYGVHCDPTVTAEVAVAHAQEYALGFPILLDHEQVLARQAGARVTPDAVLVSPSGKVLYRGRIDDRYALDGKRRDEPRVRDLENALDAVLAGGEPPVRETKAFGCPLPRLKSPGASAP